MSYSADAIKQSLFAHINLKPLQILNKKVRHIPALLRQQKPFRVKTGRLFVYGKSATTFGGRLLDGILFWFRTCTVRLLAYISPEIKIKANIHGRFPKSIALS
jgi:hypothetical protein